jgi:hypothetical protein
MSSWYAQSVRGNCLPVMVLWLAFWLVGPERMHGAETTSDYSTIKGFFGRPVNSDTMARISAVATYVDLDWKLFYAQDETGGCLVRQQQVESHRDLCAAAGRGPGTQGVPPAGSQSSR